MALPESILVALALPSCFERRERSSPLRQRLKQAGYVHTERRGDPIEDVDRRVEGPLLDAADVGPVNVSIDRQSLLRNAAVGSDFPKVPSDAGASIHATHAASLMAFKPSNMFDILGRYWGNVAILPVVQKPWPWGKK
ncbi:MAG: hypothetical protein JWQ89_897 [Devosia sp.]|nr:hypothetical protein [Devosia sp.]